MAKVSVIPIFLLLLLAFASVGMMAPAVETQQRRCSVYLSRSGCKLFACREQCFKQLNGNGNCIANWDMTDYACFCAYDC
ncbi:hypothetical protein HPP92_018312 [Vanilla planifolia]|uniref:Uncharacterized protein n=1 Tax=Vanilla planifolia TaxID=51239 RepID=A0A835UM53_VANPL|nr:hypothetical protein HPP92_018312 [Vanilla planifolia]